MSSMTISLLVGGGLGELLGQATEAWLERQVDPIGACQAHDAVLAMRGHTHPYPVVAQPHRQPGAEDEQERPAPDPGGTGVPGDHQAGVLLFALEREHHTLDLGWHTLVDDLVGDGDVLLP